MAFSSKNLVAPASHILSAFAGACIALAATYNPPPQMPGTDTPEANAYRTAITDAQIRSLHAQSTYYGHLMDCTAAKPEAVCGSDRTRALLTAAVNAAEDAVGVARAACGYEIEHEKPTGPNKYMVDRFCLDHRLSMIQHQTLQDAANKLEL